MAGSQQRPPGDDRRPSPAQPSATPVSSCCSPTPSFVSSERSLFDLAQTPPRSARTKTTTKTSTKQKASSSRSKRTTYTVSNLVKTKDKTRARYGRNGLFSKPITAIVGDKFEPPLSEEPGVEVCDVDSEAPGLNRIHPPHPPSTQLETLQTVPISGPSLASPESPSVDCEAEHSHSAQQASIRFQARALVGSASTEKAIHRGCPPVSRTSYSSSVADSPSTWRPLMGSTRHDPPHRAHRLASDPGGQSRMVYHPTIGRRSLGSFSRATSAGGFGHDPSGPCKGTIRPKQYASTAGSLAQYYVQYPVSYCTLLHHPPSRTYELLPAIEMSAVSSHLIQPNRPQGKHTGSSTPKALADLQLFAQSLKWDTSESAHEGGPSDHILNHRTKYVDDDLSGSSDLDLAVDTYEFNSYVYHHGDNNNHNITNAVSVTLGTETNRIVHTSINDTVIDIFDDNIHYMKTNVNSQQDNASDSTLQGPVHDTGPFAGYTTTNDCTKHLLGVTWEEEGGREGAGTDEQYISQSTKLPLNYNKLAERCIHTSEQRVTFDTGTSHDHLSYPPHHRSPTQ